MARIHNKNPESRKIVCISILLELQIVHVHDYVSWIGIPTLQFYLWVRAGGVQLLLGLSLLRGSNPKGPCPGGSSTLGSPSRSRPPAPLTGTGKPASIKSRDVTSPGHIKRSARRRGCPKAGFGREGARRRGRGIMLSKSINVDVTTLSHES